jgi:hypothetical protein
MSINVSDLYSINISNIKTQDKFCSTYSTLDSAKGITCAIIVETSFQLSFTNELIDFELAPKEVGCLQYDSITNVGGTDTYNNFNYNNVVYQVYKLGILKPPLNTYASPNVPCEVVLILHNFDGQTLIIYIPVNSGFTTNIPLPNDKKVQINFQNYIPSAKPFYYYFAPYACTDDDCSATTPYVIFSADSSSLTITSQDAKDLCNYIGKANVKKSESDTTTYSCLSQQTSNDFLSYYIKNNDASKSIQQVYYQAIGVNTEVPDSNDIYIKCNPTDSSGILLENYGTVPNEGNEGNGGNEGRREGDPADRLRARVRGSRRGRRHWTERGALL